MNTRNAMNIKVDKNANNAGNDIENTRVDHFVCVLAYQLTDCNIDSNENSDYAEDKSIKP